MCRDQNTSFLFARSLLIAVQRRRVKIESEEEKAKLPRAEVKGQRTNYQGYDKRIENLIRKTAKGVCKSSAEIFLSQNIADVLSPLSILSINICLLRLVFKVRAWFITNMYALLTTKCNLTMDIVGWCLMWKVKGFCYKNSMEQHNTPSALHQPGYTSRIISITTVNIKCIKFTMPYTIKFIQPRYNSLLSLQPPKHRILFYFLVESDPNPP